METAAISLLRHIQCPLPMQFFFFRCPESAACCSIESAASSAKTRDFRHLKVSRNSGACYWWQQKPRLCPAQATQGRARMTMQEKRSITHYNVLGVPEDVTDNELKESFRRIAKAFHPDLASPNQLEEYQRKFMEAYDAYSVLKDPESRALYDYQIQKASGSRDVMAFRNWRGEWRAGCNWETDQCWTS
ncbi:hypothetical protein O6H91_11G053600 [Diphasiastrum complanatum]|uniref:Uncharacterized protein n=1 Tax=Diphasiastrum complanatum TaxID=34168 RepID=A0ACC2C933_DIPCM|nr:hypothetical protein O6H91_11G053600 [Diphasiastrum complanatum]